MRFTQESTHLTPEQLLPNPTTAFQKISTIQLPTPFPPNPSFHYSTALQHYLSGRALLPDELPFSIEILHEHHLNGYITYGKGVENNHCHRCDNRKKHLFARFNCFRCKEDCTYCRNCIMMGRVSECTPLITWSGPTPTTSNQPIFDWTGTLSKAQQEASNRVVDTVQTNENLLVWAVCGAGKTEVLFKGIHEALSQNKRVCIAAPRTDVILELSPRLQKVFPNTSITTLYGGSDDRHEYGQLVLSTNHQLFRYEKAFDFIVIDEVDAFPYSYDPTLKYAVEKARKPESSIVYLTATPDSQTQKNCSAKKQNHIRIPARYHRHPIPVPRFAWCGNWNKSFEKHRIPSQLKKWTLQRLQQNKQALIFFPSVKIMEKALPLFQKLNPAIESVHAENPNRKEKVQKIRDGEIPILLTTTILERGVTIPGIDVAVAGAEDQIFTESALVQIAGRAGRSADHPKGDVVYFHYGKTKEMINAIMHIYSMNKEAGKRGLING
ncbi:DEAD/DEAH box helicase [Rossellomorea oryzaecorticis]|uniref:DEAD/DEAH box helicase n=1 Tax=Rossellomorea oryzaecorticis TaxID=1396505 RepID=A0ABW8VPZ6_9BACI